MQAQLPDGFVDETVIGPWSHIIGFLFDEEGHMFAWERAGKLYQVVEGKKVLDPVLDISEEVAFFGDHGLLAMVLHPNFSNNGYVYLLYAVDRHHLMHFGTAQYDPEKSAPHEASIGRITRYTLNPADGFRSVVAGSRKVLVGKTRKDGIPLLHISHGVGDLVFGKDGSLLFSCGDGSTYETFYAGGGGPGTYSEQALEDSIIRPKEDIGSFRAQLVDSHSGKVLRIDPETGEGLPSNPFFDPNAPAAPRSRVWALGFRNPYRLAVQPNTGSHDKEDGDPGLLYVGDVGSGTWEELDLVTEGGGNYGWPLYEGFEGSWGYWPLRALNQDAPNPLYGAGGCENTHFQFHDLLINDTENPLPFWPNPCSPGQPIPEDVPRFVHQRPALAYSNFLWNQPTRTQVGKFDSDGNPIGVNIEDAGWDYQGGAFDGTCIIGGVFYEGEAFPEAYRNRYFFADFNGWIRILDLDEQARPVKVETFHDQAGAVVHMAVNPEDGCLYYTSYKEHELHKVCYGADPAPLVSLTYDRNFGVSPLTVQFDGSRSRDPEGQPISFHWDFGDGQESTDPSPSHTFEATDGQPTPFEVVLTVTDTAGKSSQRSLTVSLNNTPPKIEITSFQDGDLYAVNGMNVLPLQAKVTDAEHAGSALHYEWQTFLHHNNHNHPEPIDTNRVTQTFLSPSGCDGELYYYVIHLTVRDEGGLFTSVSQTLNPNCNPLPLELNQGLQADFRDGKVYLNWESKWEQGLARYEIERAPDRLHFERVGSLGAEGQAHSYQFVDMSPEIGLNVYRLRYVAEAGDHQFSLPTEVETYVGLGLEVYPNPAVYILALRIQELKQEASLELVSLQGQRVLKQSWQGEGKFFQQVSVAHIEPGIYYYRLRNGGDEMNGKIVVVR
jgi:glucose/arabinose dehydrogenase